MARAETFGEWGPGTVGYYLATAFDEIWLQPTGDVTLNGLALRTTFLRKPFDKLEVEPQFGQRYKYKNAANVLLRSTFSDAHPVAGDLLDQPGDPPASPPSVGEDLLHVDAARSAAMITRIRPH